MGTEKVVTNPEPWGCSDLRPAAARISSLCFALFHHEAADGLERVRHQLDGVMALVMVGRETERNHAADGVGFLLENIQSQTMSAEDAIRAR